MKKLLSLLNLTLALGAAPLAHSQTTAFTYQGKLVDDCCPATGLYDLTFKVFDNVGPGVAGQQGLTINKVAVPVNNGLFTVSVDFDSPGSTVSAVFTGPRRWLQIDVRTNNATPPASFVTLGPRIELTATPYALRAASVPWSGLSGVPVMLTQNMISSLGQSPLELKVNGSRALRLEPNSSGAVNLIGGSAKNFVDPAVAGATISGGGADGYVEILPEFGGYASAGGNQIFADFGAIGGGANNVISNSSIFSVIGGGLLNTIRPNSILSSIGGGLQNGVHSNAAFSTIGGGLGNTVYVDCEYSTIGGGAFNQVGLPSGIYSVSALGATIGGGIGNKNEGTLSTIPGGSDNYTGGSYSLAAGRRAKANHAGAFVWADSADADFASNANDQFAIRARGGVRVSDDTPSLSFGNTTRQMLNLWGPQYGIGVQASCLYTRTTDSFAWFVNGSHSDAYNNPGPGGLSAMLLNFNGDLYINATLHQGSDRNTKTNFHAIDSREILERVAALPIQRWSYKTDPATRHIGPMAQDFHAAFKVGEDDRHITTIDSEGVALAAIQGLNQKLEERLKARDAEVEQLRNSIEELRRLISESAAKQ